MAHGKHRGLTCQACHETPTWTALSLSLRARVGAAGAAPPNGTTNPASCVDCHSALPQWRAVVETSGHRAHFSNRGRTACVRCHGAALHGRADVQKSCVGCHRADRLHRDRPDADGCLDCHNFLARADRARTVVTACLRCHGAVQGGSSLVSSAGAPRVAGPDQLHGSLECWLCHQPHYLRKPRPETEPVPAGGGGVDAAGAPLDTGARLCHDCHEIQFGTAMNRVPRGHRQCSACHQQHAPRRQALSKCQDCHEQARAVASASTSEARRHDSCASCHVPHDWVIERSACARCHEDKALSLRTRSPAQHSECIQCHAPHSTKPTGERCVECHKERATHLVQAPQRHRNCATCHDPHAASELPRKVCASCHKSQAGALAAAGPRGHASRGCLGCHQPHGDPSVISDVCARCHADKSQALTGARPSEHRQCLSCHRPHIFSIQTVSDACSRCHRKRMEAFQAHSGRCTKCHAVHGSPTVTTEACRACHTEIRTTGARPGKHHERCADCHVPHAKATAAVTRCGTCHQTQQAVASSWPANSPHAGRCSDCHRPHDPASQPQCGQCHETQAREASGGKHGCVQCHPPHRPAASTPAGWWERCASCHTAQAALTKRSAAPQHRVCGNCHHAHRFAPPACDSCHPRSTLQSGHRIPQHKPCGRCHDTHSASRPWRGQCESCHLDRDEHFPKVARCYACHPFK
jgi:hypothetical protein